MFGFFLLKDDPYRPEGRGPGHNMRAGLSRSESSSNFTSMNAKVGCRSTMTETICNRKKSVKLKRIVRLYYPNSLEGENKAIANGQQGCRKMCGSRGQSPTIRQQENSRYSIWYIYAKPKLNNPTFRGCLNPNPRKRLGKIGGFAIVDPTTRQLPTPK
jgi:hypothetical protein